jgi:hypothetical protein
MKDRTMGYAQNCDIGADNLTDCLDNVGSFTFHDPRGLLRGELLALLPIAFEPQRTVLAERDLFAVESIERPVLVYVFSLRATNSVTQRRWVMAFHKAGRRAGLCGLELAEALIWASPLLTELQ